MTKKRDRENIIVNNLNGKKKPKTASESHLHKVKTERQLRKYDNKIDNFVQPSNEEDISSLIDSNSSEIEDFIPKRLIKNRDKKTVLIKSDDGEIIEISESEVEYPEAEDFAREIINKEINDEEFNNDNEINFIPKSSQTTYFTDNYDKFKKEFIRKVKDKLAESPDLFLQEDLNEIFDMTHDEINVITENEYIDKVPKDEEWKIGVETQDIEKYEPKLKAIRKYIADQEPTIQKILDLDIKDEDRAAILNEFDMYKTSEPYSEAYHLYRESLINKIKRFDEKKVDKIIVDLIPIKINELNTSDHNKNILLNLYEECKMKNDDDRFSREKEKLFKYYLLLPYDTIKTFAPQKRQEIVPFLLQIKEKLDSELYGLEDVKEQLLLYINNKITNPSSNKNNLALCGPPGVGKTALIKAVADALGLPLELMALGGTKDSAPFKGSYQMWEGSCPSLIIEALKRMKVSNGIFLMDELDKIDREEVENALIHLTDQTLNAKSEDLFLSEITHNFSNLWFMFSMNDEHRVNKILRDRLTIINIPKYTKEELFNIVKNHTIPKNGKEIFKSFKNSTYKIDDNVINILINKSITSIRDLERIIREIFYKVNLYINTGIYPKKGWISKLQTALPISESYSDFNESKPHGEKEIILPPKKKSILPVIINENNYEDFIDLKKYITETNKPTYYI